MSQSEYELNKLYILESTITGDPFIDGNASCHAYIVKNDAANDLKKYPDTRIRDAKFYSTKNIVTICYDAGASSIVFHSDTPNKSEKLPIREQDLEPGFHNHHLCLTIARIKQEKKKKDIRQLALCNYLVPVQIRRDDDKIKVIYGTAEHSQPDIDNLYLTFSTLAEFALWQMDNPGWKPLKVSYLELHRICGKKGIMINPSGNRLVISAHLLEDVSKAYVKYEKERTRQKQEEAKVGKQ